MSWELKRKYRDRLLRERGYVRKIWGECLRICLAYPSSYPVGMSNLGVHAVYRLLNDFPTVLCERVFLPDAEEEGFYGRSLPLFSLESQRPLRDFDIIAFSLSFENDYPGVLKILSLGCINPRRSERGEEEPLIMAGGIAVTMNPEPLADFIDLFLLGEAEGVLPSFVRCLLDLWKVKRNKQEILVELQRCVEGVYVPELYRVEYGGDGKIKKFFPVDKSLPEQVRRPYASDFNLCSAAQAIVTPDTVFSDMYLIEVNRGCRRGCRFCAAGFMYRPPRFRRWGSLEGVVSNGLSVVNRVGLVGTAVSDHPDLVTMCRFILNSGGRIAVSSLRVDALKAEMVELLAEGGVDTLSLAPEAGSQRLRDLVKKDITEEHVLQMADTLLEYGILNLRLYFLLGLPSEREEDVEDIVRIVKILGGNSKKKEGKELRFRKITVSVNYFVPKAGTPMQWFPLDNVRKTEKKVRYIESALTGRREFDVRPMPVREAYIQALFSTGDRRVGEILWAVHNGESWGKALRRASFDVDFFVYRFKDKEEFLPWYFIHHGVEKSYLLEEMEKIMVLIG
ncbi:MAG: radical SAM protein [Syntrophales bacterium]|nr:radical SAM protein [Syntrophales bacterium]